MSEVVLFDSVATHGGQRIGVMTLNDPKSLNALSVEMCQLMAKQLHAWHSDDTIVAVVLRGAGDKAFCAGGNIRKLYDSMLENPPLPNPYAAHFFRHEYGLFRQMYYFAKPIILWANGIVMGGGMGLAMCSSHRVVTQTTRFAMPEISIGLYPDATGSFFLQRLPAKSGLFLGLTGAQCNAADALLANVAQFATNSDGFDAMMEALAAADWAAGDAHDVASGALSSIHRDDHLPVSQLAAHLPLITRLMNAGGIEQIDAALRSEAVRAACENDAWLARAIETYRRGCPVSACLTVELFKRAKGLSLEQVLYMEANVSLHCAQLPDFREGVRALLIDKDKSPRWSRTLKQCDAAYIDAHFEHAFGEQAHPFADWLGEQALAAQVAKGRSVLHL